MLLFHHNVKFVKMKAVEGSKQFYIMTDHPPKDVKYFKDIKSCTVLSMLNKSMV